MAHEQAQPIRKADFDAFLSRMARQPLIIEANLKGRARQEAKARWTIRQRDGLVEPGR